MSLVELADSLIFIMPTIDIALASYNGEKYIRDQIVSILSNNIDIDDFSLGSIIISDNMSTDHTAKIVSEISEQHPKVKLFENRKRGIINNFSYALAQTNADYVMLSDQDDIWLNNKVQLSIQKLLELESVSGKDVPLLVFTDLAVTDSELSISYPSFFKSQHIDPENYRYAKNIFLSNVAPGCTMIVNRKLLEMAMPFPADAVVHDWWLMLVGSILGEVACIKEPTMLYRQHGGNQIGAPTKRYRRMIFSPFENFKQAGNRLKDAGRQAMAFRQRFPHVSKDHAVSMDFLADFERMSKLKRLQGLIEKRIEHRTMIRTLNLYALALILPSSD